MQAYFSRAEMFRRHNRHQPARAALAINHPFRDDDPDIFQLAGRDLVVFLNALCNLRQDTKKLLTFVQTGDMFELWLSHAYQFKPGPNGPEWVDQRAPDRVRDWVLEIIIQNTPVIEAFRKLGNTGLADVKFLWGNHDVYLMDANVTGQVGLPVRDPTFTALNGELFCEHGHRFDEINSDNSKGRGHVLSNAAYLMPSTRPLALVNFTAPGKIKREQYLKGVEGVYTGGSQLSIYIMGHTHGRELMRFNIQKDKTND